MMSFGSDLKNIISYDKKDACWINSAFFPPFYTSGSGSTDPNESGSGFTPLFFLLRNFFPQSPIYMDSITVPLIKKKSLDMCGPFWLRMS